MMDVGGFFFYFEANRDAPRRHEYNFRLQGHVATLVHVRAVQFGAAVRREEGQTHVVRALRQKMPRRR